MFNGDRNWQPWEDRFRVVLPIALAASLIGVGVQQNSDQRIAFAGTGAWNLRRIVVRGWRVRRELRD